MNRLISTMRRHFQGIRKSPRLGLLGFLLAILIATSFQACNVGLPGPIHPTPPGKTIGIGPCSSNDDCLSGQFCNSSRCRTISIPSKQIVSLHLLPPVNQPITQTSLSILKQQFIGIDIETLNGKAIYARETQIIRGTVEGKDKDKNYPVSAQVRFIASESIPGNQLMAQTETDGSGNFELRLTIGEYDIEIIPKDERLPPYRRAKQTIAKQGDGKIPLFSFVMPEPSDCPKLKGRVIIPGSQQTVAGLSVQAYSAANKSISNVVKTDANGRFQMWLSPEEQPYRILFHMNQELPHPQVEWPVLHEKFNSGETVDLGDLPVGFSSKTIEIKGIVRTTLQDGGNELLPGSRINFSGVLPLKPYNGQNIQGYYKIQVLAEKDGSYKANIIPGNYLIEAFPPADAIEKWARASIQQNDLLQPPKNGIDFELQPKTRLTGKVCQKGESGECKQEVAQTQIQAIWRDSLTPRDVTKNPVTPAPEAPIQTARDNGWYTLPLDPGVYDLLFIPPNDSGLARRIQFGVRIEAGKKQETINVLLQQANHFVGTLVAPSINPKLAPTPISDMVVEMYSYSNDPNYPVHLLGRATTNSKGDFSLPYLLPSKE